MFRIHNIRLFHLSMWIDFEKQKTASHSLKLLQPNYDHIAGCFPTRRGESKFRDGNPHIQKIL